MWTLPDDPGQPEYAEHAPDGDDDVDDRPADAPVALRWLPSLTLSTVVSNDQALRIGHWQGSWSTAVMLELSWPLGGG